MNRRKPECKLTRRTMLGRIGLGALAPLLSPVLIRPRAAQATGLEDALEAGPLVTVDGPTRARVWVAPVDTSSTIEIGIVIGAREQWVPFPAVVNACSTIVVLNDLEPDTLYAYRIAVDGVESPGDGGEFSTPPVGAFSA